MRVFAREKYIFLPWCRAIVSRFLCFPNVSRSVVHAGPHAGCARRCFFNVPHEVSVLSHVNSSFFIGGVVAFRSGRVFSFCSPNNVLAGLVPLLYQR